VSLSYRSSAVVRLMRATGRFSAGVAATKSAITSSIVRRLFSPVRLPRVLAQWVGATVRKSLSSPAAQFGARGVGGSEVLRLPEPLLLVVLLFFPLPEAVTPKELGSTGEVGVVGAADEEATAPRCG